MWAASRAASRIPNSSWIQPILSSHHLFKTTLSYIMLTTPGAKCCEPWSSRVARPQDHKQENTMSDAPRPDGITMDGDSLQVLINAEEQYSLWPSLQPVPAGWSAIGITGSKAECLAYIDAHWVDMRPKSLRQAMDAAAGR